MDIIDMRCRPAFLHDFFGNAVFCILQLRQVTFGADHQMFDANILRDLDAGIRPFLQAVFYGGDEGGGSTTNLKRAENGAGV